MSAIGDLLAAMEADDVTQEARAGAAETSGESEPNYSNTDNIFGVEPPKNGQDTGGQGSAEGDPNGNMGGDMGDMDDMGGEGDEDSEDDFGGGEGDEEVSEEDITDANKKMVLRDNFIHLYSVIKGDLTQLSDYRFNTGSSTETNLINIINNLTEAKNNISKTLSNGFKDLKYETALTKYVSVKRVYDISIKMLYEHFDNLHKEDEKTKSSKK